MEPIIHLNDVSMVYGGNGTRATALAGISFDIRQGEYVAITGESGAGKSTLLTILGGLRVPTEGAVRIGGADLSALPADGLADFRRKTIGFVFQAYHLLPYLTARENVIVPMSPERVPSREKASLANVLLASVGFAERRTASHRSCPAGRASGWRSRGRWSTIHPCSWRTSRRGTSTARRESRSSTCSPRCTPGGRRS